MMAKKIKYNITTFPKLIWKFHDSLIGKFKYYKIGVQNVEIKNSVVKKFPNKLEVENYSGKEITDAEIRMKINNTIKKKKKFLFSIKDIINGWKSDDNIEIIIKIKLDGTMLIFDYDILSNKYENALHKKINNYLYDSINTFKKNNGQKYDRIISMV